MANELFERTLEHARAVLEGSSGASGALFGDRPGVARALAAPLPESTTSELEVIDALAAIGRRGTVASAGPRYFGFVTGGSLPAALAADWLTSTWDQNAAMAVMSPAASAVEATVLGWLRELLGLPESASGGIVTGCSMANFVAVLRGAPSPALEARLGRPDSRRVRRSTSARDRRRGASRQPRHGAALRRLRDRGDGARAWPTTTVPCAQKELASAARGRQRHPDDRLRAGRQREHGGLRSARRRRRRSAALVAPGFTSTAPSGCGQRRASAPRRSYAGSSAAIRGRPTGTSG